MDLKEFVDAYHEECAREEDEEVRSPSSYKLTPIKDNNWRFKAEMKWADELDQDIDYPDD